MSFRLTVVSLLCSALVCFPAGAMNRTRWWGGPLLNQRFVTFDWNCARTEALNERLLAIIARALPADRTGEPGTWADRAVSVRLKEGETAVLFVPTTCGAT